MKNHIWYLWVIGGLTIPLNLMAAQSNQDPRETSDQRAKNVLHNHLSQQQQKSGGVLSGDQRPPAVAQGRHPADYRGVEHHPSNFTFWSWWD